MKKSVIKPQAPKVYSVSLRPDEYGFCAVEACKNDISISAFIRRLIAKEMKRKVKK